MTFQAAIDMSCRFAALTLAGSELDSLPAMAIVVWRLVGILYLSIPEPPKKN
jgi:hypothetical protein